MQARPVGTGPRTGDSSSGEKEGSNLCKMTVQLEKGGDSFLAPGQSLGGVIQRVAGRRKNWLSLGTE